MLHVISFGILTARWRVLLTTIHMHPKNVKKVVLACIALHNFIMLNKLINSNYAPSKFVDWEDENRTLHNGL